MSQQPVTTDDLHAYADDALPPGRRAEVAAYLDQVPDAARQARVIAEQNTALRAAAAGLLDEPWPDRFRVARLFKGEPHAAAGAAPVSRWVVRSRVAAGVVAAFALGGASGWGLHPTAGAAPDRVRPLVQEAAESYAVYEPDRLHPVEISAANRDDLMSWVSARLRRSVSVPEAVAGYALLGGRVVATSRGPAAMFMYDDGRAGRVVLMVCPLSSHGDAPLSDSRQNGLAGVSWSDHGVGYSLVGATAPGELHAFGETLRRQIEDKV